ncbi:predicted protein [Aspergillus terreus NIH2624]|uniref:Uncharacterized protein n=1 Tax=Aspergillus terreus (strain NIH 2624 / FGSC A1156) TaxID=341663 RepID=Q0CF23_ASPTN|nr:uncharacterized protein ATEG_07711 [Aspergillus terreus NIH2624]EAU31973.1 predicted protein [Aspergillus terreus NIH2624]
MEELNCLLQEHLDDLLKPGEAFDWAEEVEESLTDYTSDDEHSTFMTDSTTFSDTTSAHSSEMHVPDDIRAEGVEETPTVEVHVPDDIQANVYNESFYIGCNPSDPYPRPERFKPSLYTIDELDELLMEENQEPDMTDVPGSDDEIEDLFTQIEAHLNSEPDMTDVPASEGEIKDLYTQIEAHLDAEPDTTDVPVSDRDIKNLYTQIEAHLDAEPHEPSPPPPYDDGPTRSSKPPKLKSKIARLMRVGISECFRWVYTLLEPVLP